MTWHAIRVAPQRETAVAAALKVKGYTFFIPVELRERRASRHVKPTPTNLITVERPMFPGYVFLAVPVFYHAVLAERHVVGFVGFSGTIGSISDEAMERLMAMSGQMRPDVSTNKQRALKTGDMAKISSGPFTGHVVKVTGLHGNRARIFLNLFGSRREAEVEQQQLEVA